MDLKQELIAIGERLKLDRERAGLTQEDVAEHLTSLGDPKLAVKRPTVANWEAGRNMPCLVQFRELCALYGVTGYRTMMGASLYELSVDESKELSQLSRTCSAGLRGKLELLLTMLAAAGADRAPAPPR